MSGTGIFGGSFDPVHEGHRKLALVAVKELGLDRLIVLPAANSPFKVGQKHASDADRLAMCKLAFADHPQIEVSDLELVRGGVSYTYLTLKEFANPGKKLYLLTGADAFLTVQDWKYAPLIAQDVFFVGVCRSGDEQENLKKHADFLQALGFSVRLMPFEPLVLSSTEIRGRLKNGLSTEGLLLPSVREYIFTHGLYGITETHIT
ncbi:MAG TPA: nicotinate (nicotinamide) nucleotide adenylyltransferase [Oscillospiraceae bacterium]|nr:nicotinate (nicotinamide) nucleotide adenylyltransferase [Oscillospiraceae bacterium]HPS35309.1 nicotinate (nicotinamide) nucleotide adenylyltransferase [Oscillospiraceae bacterium]